MPAPNEIIELVEKFKNCKHDYKNPKYDEENTKMDFINPFFEALGWDIYNKKHRSPSYKDVMFENSIKVGSKTKSPDYAFRIGGQVKFFVEAKKPSVDIERDKNPAFQIRRYGWSAKLDLCILTDFETLAVYETNAKPDRNESARNSRIKLYSYTDYVDKWDEIANIFSKEAILKGNFDNYVSGHEGIKKGTSTVDNEFLKEIEYWREILAKNIALRNKSIDVEELNYAVQLIIDRIIFLRIAEDRGIETYGTLKKLLEEKNIYTNFCEICKVADGKYNSGLFHFTKEKENDSTVDIHTLNLNIDDKVFEKIIKNLYYPNSPYEFSVLPLEILGKVYENFLGKTIRLTEGHRAKVEERPEVKKNGGVYYTPQYIVDYMVKNTVGKKIKNKTPNQISKLSFLDPACGSGSFLIRIYQYLLDYHLDYYSKLDKKPKNVIYEVESENKEDKNYKLTIQEKKRILKNNIYGVDKDPLAVEVTKLSLLLKVLEDQKKDMLEAQQKLFKERALPNLSDNIQNGNSLLDSVMLSDYDLDIEEIIKLNPFDWNNEFKNIMDNGGFDIILGNPPYIKESTNRRAFDGLRDSPYYQGKMDLWYMFACKSLDLIKDNGLVSFIATNNWITSYGASKLRNKITDDAKFELFIDFGNYKVFNNVGIQTMIYIMKKNNKNNSYRFKYLKLLEDKIGKEMVNNFLEQKETLPLCDSFETIFNRKDNKDSYFNFIRKDVELILNKLKENNSTIFLDKSEVSTGIDVHQDFLNKKGSEQLKIPVGSGIFVINDEEKEFLNLNENEFNLIKPYYTSDELNRFYSNNKNRFWVIYTKSDINSKIKKYPNIKKHFDKYKSVITSDNKPYGLHRARKENIFINEKIIVTRKCTIPTFSYVPFDAYVSQTFMIINSDRLNLKYLTGILNSSLIQFWLKFKGKMQGNNYQLDKQPLLQVPIILANKEKEDSMIRLVDNMIYLNKRLHETKKSNEKRIINNQIQITNDKINQLVYQLYNLTDEEVQIIEDELK